MRRRQFIVLIALGASFVSVAQFDDLGDLRGSTIAYAGAFEVLSCPIAGRYDCMTWPTNLLRTRDGQFCFATSASDRCTSVCQGVLAAGSDRRVRVFLFESGGVKEGDVRPFRCPGVL